MNLLLHNITRPDSIPLLIAVLVCLYAIYENVEASYSAERRKRDERRKSENQER